MGKDNEQIERLLSIMARLRDPDGGCPWDVEQTFATIAPHTIEEAYEVADAIEHGDMHELRDELGDLLFQVVFHAQMAAEAGAFDFTDVARAVSDKMVRRHPHVFGDASIEGAEAQTAAWEEMKAGERNDKDADESALAGVSPGFPALTRAVKLQKRAGRVGFDWTEARRVIAKVHEELAEIEHELDTDGPYERLEDEIGDLLFACANLARKLKIDAETALRLGNLKFERRFRRMEALVAEAGKTLSDTPLEELEAFWEASKRAETEA